MQEIKNLKKNDIFLSLPDLKEKVKNYAKHAFAKNTLVNYQSDWQNFAIWCKSLEIEPLSANHQTLTAYITTLAEQKYKASTIQRKISGIVKFCETKNIHIDVQNKDFKIVWQGIRRKLGIAKQGKDPILLKDLEDILEHIPQNSSMGVRDRTLLIFGWFSAMRRSEIVSLNWEDISFIKEGIIITIRQSKTDKFSQGQKIAILKRKHHPCPVKELKIWKTLNNSEAIFCSVTKNDRITGKRLSNIDVARIVKKWAVTLDFDITKIEGHSLRRGFVTTAVNCGIRNHIIMKTTRHKSSKMIDDYTGDHSLLENNATGMIEANNKSFYKQKISGLVSNKCSQYKEYFQSQTAGFYRFYQNLWQKF